MSLDVDHLKRLDGEFDAARRDFVKAKVRFLVLEGLAVSQEFPAGLFFYHSYNNLTPISVRLKVCSEKVFYSISNQLAGAYSCVNLLRYIQLYSTDLTRNTTK